MTLEDEVKTEESTEEIVDTETPNETAPADTSVTDIAKIDAKVEVLSAKLDVVIDAITKANETNENDEGVEDEEEYIY